MRYLLLLQLVLLCLLAAPLAWADEPSAPLQIFCQDVTESPQARADLRTNDPRWQKLAAAMRDAADPSFVVEPSRRSPEEWRDCLQRYAEVFRRGDFILRGLEVTSLVETLIGSGEAVEAFTVDSPRSRSAPYEAAWESFLKELRSSLTGSLSAENH